MTVPFRDRTRLRMTVVGAIVVAAALALLAGLAGYQQVRLQRQRHLGLCRQPNHSQ